MLGEKDEELLNFSLALQQPGGRRDVIELLSDTFTYEWYRIWEDVRNKPNHIPEPPSHTELYKRPKSDTPNKIFVFGSGESVAWLAIHFPDSEIYYFTNNKEKLRWVPAYGDDGKYKHKLHHVYYNQTDKPLNESRLRVKSELGDKIVVEFTDEEGKKIEGRLFKAVGFKASNFAEGIVPES